MNGRSISSCANPNARRDDARAEFTSQGHMVRVQFRSESHTGLRSHDLKTTTLHQKKQFPVRRIIQALSAVHAHIDYVISHGCQRSNS